MRWRWLGLVAGVVLFGGAAAGLGIRGSSAESPSVRAKLPMVARDGPIPTPTPKPPPPAVASKCFRPRVADSFTLRPAPAKSVLQNCQVIAYYGYPGVPGLGVLGQFESSAALASALESQAAASDAVNGSRTVVPALHLIAAIVHEDAGPDGTYLGHMPGEMLDASIALAAEHDWLVILDLQMGHSTIDAEFSRVEPYLRNPRVHLALDPEWVTPGPPGSVIGSMDASMINRAQELLQALVDRERLPNKLLIVHQFTRDMITDKAAIIDEPGVDLVIDIDGYGAAAAKQSEYQAFVQDDGAEHGGMKLFYTQDVDLMTPETASNLIPQPDVIIYQ